MSEAIRMRLQLGLDAHVHAREGRMLEMVVPHTAAQFGAGIFMPNTKKPILTGDDAVGYRQVIENVAHQTNPGFRAFPLIQITPATTPAIVLDAQKKGVIGGKAYPRKVTTNSEHGIIDYTKCIEVFKAMRDCGMVLSLHGEDPDPNVEGRDKASSFVRNILPMIIRYVPGLRIVLEHISVLDAANFVAYPPLGVVIAATITPHHLVYINDDTVGYSEQSGGCGNPHLVCKPMLQTRKDRNALCIVATTDNSLRFFHGSDSAPHLRKEKKEAKRIYCGVFNAPVALPVLVGIFDQLRCMSRIETYTAVSGFAFWGITRSDGYVVLEKQEWTVPDAYPVPGTDDDVVPMMAGEKLNWRVVGLEGV